MAQNVELLVFPIKDIEKAKEFYGMFLGVDPYVASPFYVGYNVGNLEVGLDPNSRVGPICYVDVNEIESSIEGLIKVGAEIVHGIRNVGGGLLIAQIKDSDGNIVGLRGKS